MNAVVPWIDARRAEASARFRALGVPHRRIEEWKYSDLRTALDGANDVAPSAKWELSALPAGVELFDLSNPAGAPDWVVKAFGTLTASDAMSSASLAEARVGFALKVSRGTVVRGTVNLTLSGTGPLRGLIVLEESASLTLMETAAGSAGFTNAGIRDRTRRKCAPHTYSLGRECARCGAGRGDRRESGARCALSRALLQRWCKAVAA